MLFRSFIAVLKRELHRMTARRIYIIASVVLPLFSVFFMATIFGTGQMQNLPVGVVDYNNSATSRNLVRMVEADPTFDVLKHYGTDTEARSDVQRKYIYAYLSIPPEFESKVGDGKKVALTYYYHYALLSVGTDLKGGFQSLLKTYSAAPIVAKAISLGIDKDEIESFLLPISTQNHPLFNPDMNYSVYLTQPFYYVFFQVLLLLITIYSLGSEGKFHTSNEWLKTADNNIFVAVVAKLLPYTIIFICISIFANYFFFVVKQIPMHCSFLTLNLITVLFIFATQALGIFLFSL